MYDAVWVLANTLAVSGATDTSWPNFKTEFVSQANGYFGATGQTSLNEAGDRKVGNFDFWRISVNNGNIQWIKSAYYNGASDQATRTSGNK